MKSYDIRREKQKVYKRIDSAPGTRFLARKRRQSHGSFLFLFTACVVSLLEKNLPYAFEQIFCFFPTFPKLLCSDLVQAICLGDVYILKKSTLFARRAGGSGH